MCEHVVDPVGHEDVRIFNKKPKGAWSYDRDKLRKYNSYLLNFAFY